MMSNLEHTRHGVLVGRIRGSMRVSSRSRGVTLIEILVVLAIMVSIMAIGYFVLGAITTSRLKDETLKFSGAVYHVYGQAAIRNLVYRVVIDMDEQKYWSEVADGLVVLPKEESGSFSDPFEDFMGEDDEEGMFNLNRKALFEPADDTLLPPRELKPPIKFAGVMTPRYEEMVVEGQVSITFFPSGYCERAVIYFTDGEGYYTLTIDPLTGKTHIYAEKKDIDKDFFEEKSDDW